MFLSLNNALIKCCDTSWATIHVHSKAVLNCCSHQLLHLDPFLVINILWYLPVPTLVLTDCSLCNSNVPLGLVFGSGLGYFISTFCAEVQCISTRGIIMDVLKNEVRKPRFLLPSIDTSSQRQSSHNGRELTESAPGHQVYYLRPPPHLLHLLQNQPSSLSLMLSSFIPLRLQPCFAARLSWSPSSWLLQLASPGA
jgi:hypothetical protein